MSIHQAWDGAQVAGNFHFAPGKSFQQGAMHVHDLVPFQGLTFDLSHNIDKLSFGREYPGMKNPLDAVRVAKHNTRNPQGLAGTYQYFLKVRPISYRRCFTAMTFVFPITFTRAVFSSEWECLSCYYCSRICPTEPSRGSTAL